MSKRTSYECNETYLTTKQAAEILQVSAKTLESWRRTQLQGPPYCKQGHLVRYRLSDLEAYMQEILVEPAKIDRISDVIKFPKTVRLSATKSVESND